jgi:hypothetical protein
MRLSHIVVIGVVCFAAVTVVAWLVTSGIAGEAFVVNHGHAVALPGASITLYRVDRTQKDKILAEISANRTRYAEDASQLKQFAHEAETALASGVPAEIAIDGFDRHAHLAEMKFCFGLANTLSYAPTPSISGNADREGHFSFNVNPGNYFVHMVAETGKRHVEWFEFVHVRWREQLRLVEPTCSYSAVD